MILRGAIYHHSKMIFHDGSHGIKYLVLMNSPDGDEPYLFVKTTSRPNRKPFIEGCSMEKSLFFIKADKTFFKKDTWIQLHEIYEIPKADISKERGLQKVGSLDEKITDEIVECYLKSQEDDILPKHRKLLKPPIKEAIEKLAEKFRKKI